MSKKFDFNKILEELFNKEKLKLDELGKNRIGLYVLHYIVAIFCVLMFVFDYLKN